MYVAMDKDTSSHYRSSGKSGQQQSPGADHQQ